MTQQLSSQQLSSLPAGKSLSPTTLSNINVQLAEAGTSQLVSQSLFHLRDYPNPQLVSEAVNIGATQDVASSLADPTLGQYMTATPGSQNPTPKGPDNGPGKSGANLDSFDWKAYWGGDNQQQLEQNPQYKALGVVPQMNVAWMNGVMQNSNPKETSKWQQWLIDHGTLDKNHGAQGTWDDASKGALSAYMVMLTAPDALWSKDSQRQAQANNFLARLGVQTGTLASDVGRNPNQQRSVVLGYMQAYGDPQHQGDALRHFSDNYGSDKLTAAEQQIAKGPGILGDIGQALNTVGSMINPVDDIAHIVGIFNQDASKAIMASPLEGIGSVMDPMKDISRGIGLFNKGAQNAFDTAIDPQKRADAAGAAIQREGFTPQEQAALAPALQQVANNQGFLPLEWIDQKSSEMFLTAWYALDAGGGGGAGHHMSNPFDALNPHSDLGMRISAHTNNLAGAVFGDQFAKEHTSLSALTEGIMHTVDDPLTYLMGPAMRGPALTRDLLKAVRGQPVIDAATGLGIKASMGDAANAALSRFLNPKAEMTRVMSHGIFAKKDSLSTIYKALRVTDHTLRGAASSKIQASIDRIQAAQSVDEVRTELMGTFSHNMHTPAFVLNARDAAEAFSQTVSKAGGEAHRLSMRSMGAFRDSGLAQAIREPIKMERTLRQVLKIVGGSNEDITKMMDEWLKVPEGERDTWLDDKFMQALDENISKNFTGKSLEDARVWAQNMAKSRSYVVKPEIEEKLGPAARIKQAKYQPAQVGETTVNPKTGQPYQPGEEMSKAPRKYPKGTQTYIDNLQKMVDSHDQAYKIAVNDGTKALMKADPALAPMDAIDKYLASPEGRAFTAEKDAAVAEALKEVNSLAPQGIDRPMPGSEGQLNAKWMLPVSPYELYTYLNEGSVLKNVEEFQAHVRADAFYSIWKGLALARPGTAIRVMVGDDTSRFLVEMAMNGHPAAALRAFMQASGMGLYAGLGHGAQAVLGKTIGKVPVGGQTLGETAGLIGEHTGLSRVSPTAARARADRISKNMDYHDTMTLAKALNEVIDSVFHTFYPEVDHPDAYLRAFRDWFRANWANSPTNKEWAQIRYGNAKGELAKYGKGDAAALQYLKDVATGKVADKEGVQHIINTKQVDAEKWAETQDHYLRSVTSNRELLRMAGKGEIGSSLGSLYKANIKSFPIIAAPRPNIFSKNFMVRALKNGPQSAFRAIAEPMIYASRAEGGWALKQMYEKHLDQVHPDWSPEERASLASDQATHWMEDNLYNGQRTLLGRSLRHIFPFDGATTNMARFYIRQVRGHPWLAEPLARFSIYEEQQAANNQDTSLLFNNNILSALGFAGSDALTGNLAHSFFLTSDGLASFIPGVGPIFTPLLSFVANDQALRDEFSGVPGLREQLQFAAGRSTGANPLQTVAGDLLPSWFSNQVDALGLISPLHSPLLSGITGTGEDYNRKMDMKAKQLYADYLDGKRSAPPTTDDIKASVGADMMLAGGVGDIAPITPAVVDERSKLATQFSNSMSTATTPQQRDAVYKSAEQAGKNTGFDLTPLLLYHDPKTTLDEQDRLVNDNPWIAPYVTSMYEAKGPKPSTLSEYDAAIANGDLHALGVGEIVPQIANKVRDAYLWVKYQGIRNAQATFLQANGVTTSSPEYKAYLASTINPLIQQLEQQGGDSQDQTSWTAKFLKSTSTSVPGLTANTQPLRTVSTFDVLPITADLENGRSIAWRKALINMKEASARLALVRAEGGSKADEQTIIDGLATQLQGVASTSADFANELQYYGFSKFEDIVNLQTQMGAPGYGTGA